jgi:bifunctional DNA-binding transcriptional regulator/antitoxin component of YhaV-PrlF toxin-antitoxin module
MNEVKMSTQIQEGQKNRLAIKFDIHSMGLNWQRGDILRVISHKKENRLILKKVSAKSFKKICHKITSTSGGENPYLGIYIQYGARRFKQAFDKMNSVVPAFRLISPSEVEIYMPEEAF